MEKKKIVFVTGTRADYGKIKPLIKVLECDMFDVHIFVCGMHLLKKFGSTYEEVLKDNYKNIYVAFGLSLSQDSGANLGNTIACLSGYVQNLEPDMIIVHGDRMDALAGAVVGALNNIIVGHIEGGELSGTIDESIRHAISKFAHVHFVCTEEAKNRLIQLGEEKNRIFIIGSPDIDIMMSNNLPSLEEAKLRYDISFNEYSIVMYHPVTTEYSITQKNIKTVVDALIESENNYIVIYPNNDLGSEFIINEYSRLDNNSKVKIYPSLRFEYFLTLLKNAKFILGNSSAGIRESSIYGVPAIDIGTRQNGRYSTQSSKNIQHTSENKEEILNAIKLSEKYRESSFIFGDGDSTSKFFEILINKSFWEMPIQKRFIDYDM